MFECQIHMWRTPLKWLPFSIHENKLLHEVQEIRLSYAETKKLYKNYIFV